MWLSDLVGLFLYEKLINWLFSRRERSTQLPLHSCGISLSLSFCFFSSSLSFSLSRWNWGQSLSVISHNWNKTRRKKRPGEATELWPQLGLQHEGQYPGGRGGWQGKKKEDEGGEEHWNSANNINRNEMKQHPHFLFFAYSLCLPPGIDHITPDILVTPFNRLTGDDAHTRKRADWCKQQAGRNRLSVYFLSFRVLLEIAARSEKCHVLDLFAPLHSGVWRGWSHVSMWGGGFAELRGLQQRQGCVPQITLQLLMEPGPPLLERTCRSASNRSPLWTTLAMIGFSYRAQICWW